MIVRLPVAASVRLIQSVRSSVTHGAFRAGPTTTPALVEVPWGRRWDLPWALRLAAALLGLAAIVTYLVVALLRLAYPFPLEFLESNSLVEVQRILAGRPLYAAPTVSYVPDGYPPLYFATSAAVASVLGLSYLPLRLVSLVSSLVCFAVLARLVQRETASAAAGIASAGLLAATYFVADTWFDVARVDSEFIALSVAALYCARWMRRTRGAVATGLLLGAVFLTKQNGLAEGVAVLTALACGSRRRLAWPAALAYGAAVGGSTVVLGLMSHGWYVFYVWQLLGEHTLNHAAFAQFWTEYILPMLGLACCALVLGVRRASPVLLAGCAALVVESYASLVHSNGKVNDMLPAFLVVALLAGLAMGGHPGGLVSWGADRLAGPQSASGRTGRTGPSVGAAAAALVIAQLTSLIAGFHPGQAIPTSADRAVGERLTSRLAGLGGTIAVPTDPGLILLAGLPAVAHQAATDDILHASNLAAIASFTRSAARAVAVREFSAIVTESAAPPDGFPADLPRYYHRCPQTLMAGVPPPVFQPVAGPTGRPVYVWLPVGGASCAATVHALVASAPGTPTEAQPRPVSSSVSRSGGMS